MDWGASNHKHRRPTTWPCVASACIMRRPSAALALTLTVTTCSSSLGLLHCPTAFVWSQGAKPTTAGGVRFPSSLRSPLDRREFVHFIHSKRRRLSPTSLQGGKEEDPALSNAGLPHRIVDQWARWRPNLGIADEFGYLTLAALVGLLTGLLVTAFKLCIGFLKGYLYGDFVGQLMDFLGPVVPFSVALGVVPIVGGLSVALLRMATLYLAGEKNFGPGLGGLIEEAESGLPFNARRSLLKALAAIVTLGSGNSLGPEGPAVELGVAGSRLVSSLGDLSLQRRRILLGAGAAAGVAAGFNAPVAAVFFALEVVGDCFSSHPPLSSKAGVAATLLSAAIGTLVAKVGLNEEYALAPAIYSLESPLVELPFYLLLGVASGLVAVMFQYFVAGSTRFFKGKIEGYKWMGNVPSHFRPLLGAAVVALLAARYPQILFFGYETLDALLDNSSGYSLFLLLQLCVVKAFATAVCVGSGLVGGTFAPSLFLGATAGAAYQQAISGLVNWARSVSPAMIPSVMAAVSGGAPAVADGLPGLLQVADAPAYAMVGAASVLAAVYRAPLTSSLLLFELTRDYEIVLPLMASAGVATIITLLLQNEKAIPEEGVPMGFVESGLGPSARRDFVLQGLLCEDAAMPSVLALLASQTIGGAIDTLQAERADFALVIPVPAADPANNETTAVGPVRVQKGEALAICGIVATRDLINALSREKMNVQDASSESLQEVYRQDFFSAGPQDALASAKAIFDKQGVRYVPLVEMVGGEMRCKGVVSEESLGVALRTTETSQKMSQLRLKNAEAEASRN